MRNNIKLIVLIILLISFSSISASEFIQTSGMHREGQDIQLKELFVSPSGNDTSPGTRKEPLFSVQAAVNQLSAGDTLTLLSGTWNLDRPVLVSLTGRDNAWITIRGEEGGEVILDGKNSDIPHTGKYPNNNGLIQIENAEYIRIQNIHVRNSSRSGINIQESHHIDVFNCVSENSLSPGIAAWQHCTYINVFGNTVINANNMKMSRVPFRGREAPHEAISMAGPHHFEVAYNHVYNCRKEGIDVKETASFGLVHHNYIHHCDRQGLYIDGWFGQLQNIDMYQNVVHDCEAGIAVSSEEGPDTRNLNIHHNLIFNNRATGLFFSRWGADNPRENVKVYNNTFYRNGWGKNFEGDPQYWLNGGCYLFSVNLLNIHIYNNIFARNFPFEIGRTSLFEKDFLKTKNIKVEYNLIDDVNTIEYPLYLSTWLKDTVYSFTGSHPIEQNALFIDPENHDFRLQPGSPAIKAGIGAEGQTEMREKFTDLGALPYGTAVGDFWWKTNFPPRINATNFSGFSKQQP